MNQARGGRIAKNWKTCLETRGFGNNRYRQSLEYLQDQDDISSLMVNKDTRQQGMAELRES